MSMHSILMKLPVIERYEFIRKIYSISGCNINQTSIKLGISYNTVKNAIENPSPKERTYETKVKEEHIVFIHSETLLKPDITGQELAQKLLEEFDLEITEQWVNEIRRKRLNLQFKPPLRSVFISDEAALKRYNWTSRHLQANSHFRNVVFSDESWFLLGRRKKWIWVDRYNLNENMFSKTQAHPPKVMIWGAIGWNFKSQIVIFDGSVNSERYIEDVIFGSDVIEDADRCWGVGKWIFQQDNAPAHNSKETKATLKELGIDVLDWPPYSPDLNVIEVIWAIMEARIEKKKILNL